VDLNPVPVTDASPAAGDLYYFFAKQKIYTVIDANTDTETIPHIPLLVFDEVDASKTGPVIPKASTFYQTKAGESYRWIGGNLELTDALPPKESTPMRRGLDNKGFSFFYPSTDTYNSEANPKPVNGDTDTNYTGYTDDANKWYVNAYVVSVGQDMNFALSYSRIAELGYIIISQL
jgi:hypothetical protein